MRFKKILKISVIVLVALAVLGLGSLLFKGQPTEWKYLGYDKVQVFEDIDKEVSEKDIEKGTTLIGNCTERYSFIDVTLFEETCVYKIGVPIYKLNNCYKDQNIIVYVVEDLGEPDPADTGGLEYMRMFEVIKEYELIIKANTYSHNNIYEWVYFDCEIEVAHGQSLAFEFPDVTVYRDNNSLDYNSMYSDETGDVFGLYPGGNFILDIYCYKEHVEDKE